MNKMFCVEEDEDEVSEQRRKEGGEVASDVLLVMATCLINSTEHSV